MLYLVWFISLIASFAIGYWISDLTKKLKEVKTILETKADKPEVKREPQSMLIDELDPVQVAMYEHEKMMKQLNPDR